MTRSEAEVVPQDVVLRDGGADPAAVAEVVRAMTGLEPSAAQDLVARAPSVVRTRIAPALAEALRLKFVAAGATVEVRPHAPQAAAPELFDVYLQDKGTHKIAVVRVVKMSLGLGLREAVDLVDEAPCLLRRRVERDEAEVLRHELVEAGAVVEVRVHDGSAPQERTAGQGEAPVTWGAAATTNERQHGFGVILHDYGVNKIAVIKAIREATGLGLKESMDIAEGSGVPVKLGMTASEAKLLERALAGVGARVEVVGSGEPEAQVPAPSSSCFDVVLREHGPYKIAVVKLIRELTSMGLKDAKDLAETPGAEVMRGLESASAEALARRFVEIGAAVELRPRSGPGSKAEVPKAEPAWVDVFLQSYGPNKILVIKEVRARTGLGLKDAKDLVEAAPRLIQGNVDIATARQFQRALVEVGAVVELR